MPKFPTTGYLDETKNQSLKEKMTGIFGNLKEYNSDRDKVKYIMTSGRAIGAMKGVANDSGYKGWMIGEHGTHLFNVDTREEKTIYDIVPEYAKYRVTLNMMEDIRDILGDLHPKILSKLGSGTGIDVKGNGLAPGKKTTAAYDLPYLGEIGISDRVNPLHIFEIAWPEIPRKYKEIMSTDQESLLKFVDNKKDDYLIRVFYDKSAINFTTPISKPDSMRPEVSKFVLGKNIEQEDSVFGDDQDFVSIEKKKGMVCTVSDGSEKIKDYILNRIRNGEDGYVSKYPNSDGALDILETVNRKNLEIRK